MKDKVLRMNDNQRVYVVDELNYEDKKYIFAFEIDDNDDLLEDKPHTLEVLIENDSLILNEIENFEIASIVNNMFITRLASGE